MADLSVLHFCPDSHEIAMNPYEPPKSSESQPSFLNATLTAVTCPHCQHKYEDVAKKSFLGFKKFVCQSCHETFSYPLFRTHRITYWLLLVAAVAFMFKAPNVRPNIFVILMGTAVLVDLYLLWKRR